MTGEMSKEDEKISEKFFINIQTKYSWVIQFPYHVFVLFFALVASFLVFFQTVTWYFGLALFASLYFILHILYPFLLSFIMQRGSYQLLNLYQNEVRVVSKQTWQFGEMVTFGTPHGNLRAQFENRLNENDITYLSDRIRMGSINDSMDIPRYFIDKDKNKYELRVIEGKFVPQLIDG